MQFFDEILNISNTPQIGVKTSLVLKLFMQISLSIGGCRLMPAKWMVGKLRPRKYGDKQPDPNGAAGENKLVIEVRGGMPPDEIEGGGG
jgi:hypothetical protein